MAELADAHGSGPCGSNTMRVQVSFPARYQMTRKVENSGFLPFLLYLKTHQNSVSEVSVGLNG